MKTQNADCPPESALSDFGLGKLDAASSATVSQHLETCADCRQRVANLPADSFVERLRAAQAPKAAPKDWDRTFDPGDSISSAMSGSETPTADLYEPAAGPALSPTGGPISGAQAGPTELAGHPDFEVLRELGQGGIGTVYLARNRLMDRFEVLKVVNKALLEQPGALERFQQEIRAAARLNHANIVAAYRVLRPSGLLVFAMEHVEGQDLARLVKRRGPLPVANAAFYAHQAALGLQHAFEKGMVHRDVKPSNLMLSIQGKKHVVKILDFGLAKATTKMEVAGGLTKSGQMLGTPEYAAPEQILDAQKADIRADVYSLGCSLYFLLSGAPPFEETNLYKVLHAHQTREARPLNLVRPEVPAELAAVVAKMMAKDPAKRYQTPIEAAEALVPFFKSGARPAGGGLIPIAAAPSASQPFLTLRARLLTLKFRQRPWLAGATGVAFFLAVLLGAVVLVRNDKGQGMARIEVPEGGSIEVSPDATQPVKEPTNPKPPPATVNGAAIMKSTESAPTGASVSADQQGMGVPETGMAAPTNSRQAKVIAHFLFNGNSKDEISDASTSYLKNVEYRDDAIFVNGLDMHDGSGYGASVHLITDPMDLRAFTVALRCKPSLFGRTHDALLSTCVPRWLLVSRSHKGNLCVSLNQGAYFHEFEGAKIDVDQWTTIAFGIDLDAHKCVVYLNGTKAGDSGVPTSLQLADGGATRPTWTFGDHFRSAEVRNVSTYDGLVDEFIVYDKLLSPDEFARIPLRADASSPAASRHPRMSTDDALLEAAAREAAAKNNGAPAKLVAHFLFNGDGSDEMRDDNAAELKNVEFRDDAIYLNGKYSSDRNGEGYVALLRTRPFDMSHFTVAIRFKADDFADNHYSIFADQSGWFTMQRALAGGPHPGNLFFQLAKNAEFYRVVPGTKLEQGEWTVVAFGADLNVGKAIVYFNGALAQEYDIPRTLERKDGGTPQNQPLTFTCGSATFHGLVDELLVYDQLLTPEEFAKIPLRVEATSPSESRHRDRDATDELPFKPVPVPNVAPSNPGSKNQ